MREGKQEGVASPSPVVRPQATMTTLQTLYEGLHLSPDDWQARAVLADWFEETGQQACCPTACGWMIKQRKR